VNRAIRRLTGKRLPEEPGVHELLFLNQQDFIQAHPELRDLWRLYEGYFDSYVTNVQAGSEHYADAHIKRELRIKAWNDLIDSGNLHVDGNTWSRNERHTYKMKPAEILLWNKVPRMIVDLGVEASLRGFRLFEHLKQAQNEKPIYILGGEFFFCKSPSPAVMKEIFEKLEHPPLRFFYVYFSDDCCISYRQNDGSIVKGNGDIEKCDGSQGPSVFELLVHLFPERIRPDVEILVDQCLEPMLIRDNTENSRLFVLLQPIFAILKSGWGGTTAINNLANLLIGMALIENWGRLVPRESAKLAGYLFKFQVCDKIQDLQFLKHSPVIDVDGNLQPCLNYGVMLRAQGNCHRDLPGRGPIRQRALDFQASIVRGMYPYVSTPILSNMMRASGDPIYMSLLNLDFKIVDSEKYTPYRVTTEEFLRRYDLTPFELYEIETVFSNLTFGDHFASLALAKILNKDYGLNCRAVESYNTEHVLPPFM
jgi:hypothetical protein